MSEEQDELFPDGTRRGEMQPLLAGRYQVVRELGRGAMGAVYLAKDETLDGLHVALKMPPAVLARNASAMAQLKREALLARKLVHPNIVTLRTLEVTDEGTFLVMDYIDGRTLEEVLAEREVLSEGEVRDMFRPLAAALDHAHALGVVHRDIKPSNIMIRGDGTPLLADFGIARELKDGITRTTGHQSSGTLPYMSPEQVRGSAASPSQDVYGLAATMYECLAGHPPLHRGQLEWQIINEKPEALPGQAHGLAASILLGLSKEADARPSNCADLVSGDTTQAAATPPAQTGTSARQEPTESDQTTVPCPECSQHILPTARKCQHCGFPMIGDRPTPPPRVRPPVRSARAPRASGTARAPRASGGARASGRGNLVVNQSTEVVNQGWGAASCLVWTIVGVLGFILLIGMLLA